MFCLFVPSPVHVCKRINFVYCCDFVWGMIRRFMKGVGIVSFLSHQKIMIAQRKEIWSDPIHLMSIVLELCNFNQI